MDRTVKNSVAHLGLGRMSWIPWRTLEKGGKRLQNSQLHHTDPTKEVKKYMQLQNLKKSKRSDTVQGSATQFGHSK